jgi:hypothetical protein
MGRSHKEEQAKHQNQQQEVHLLKKGRKNNR